MTSVYQIMTSVKQGRSSFWRYFWAIPSGRTPSGSVQDSKGGNTTGSVGVIRVWVSLRAWRPQVQAFTSSWRRCPGGRRFSCLRLCMGSLLTKGADMYARHACISMPLVESRGSLIIHRTADPSLTSLVRQGRSENRGKAWNPEASLGRGGTWREVGQHRGVPYR